MLSPCCVGFKYTYLSAVVVYLVQHELIKVWNFVHVIISLLGLYMWNISFHFAYFEVGVNQGRHLHFCGRIYCPKFLKCTKTTLLNRNCWQPFPLKNRREFYGSTILELAIMSTFCNMNSEKTQFIWRFQLTPCRWIFLTLQQHHHRMQKERILW